MKVNSLVRAVRESPCVSKRSRTKLGVHAIPVRKSLTRCPLTAPDFRIRRHESKPGKSAEGDVWSFAARISAFDWHAKVVAQERLQNVGEMGNSLKIPKVFCLYYLKRFRLFVNIYTEKFFFYLKFTGDKSTPIYPDEISHYGEWRIVVRINYY